jgi:two-component sensor histidine kinase
MQLATLKIETDRDIPRLRELGQAAAEACGIPRFHVTRVVTALLEMGRNMLQHGGGGKLMLSLMRRGDRVVLTADATDQGPGITDLEGHLSGRLAGAGSGMGLGLRGIARLAEDMDVQTGSEGTHIAASFATPITPADFETRAAEVLATLERLKHADPAEMLVQQNRDLVDVLAERDLLMAELHHRVKNNLSMVTALMRLSRKSARSEETRQVLRDLEMQMRAIVLVHDRLQHSAASDRVPLTPLLEVVAQQYCTAFGVSNREVEVSVHGADVILDGRAITDIALAVGELITNALKHAFEGRARGRIEVTVALDEAHLQVTVADDGVGLPPEVDRPERSDSLGWVMIRSAVQKHGGFIRTRSENGLSVELTLMAETVGATRQAEAL